MDFRSRLENIDPASIKRSKLVEVEKVSLLAETAENWGQIWDFKAWADDLLICTYPKAGKRG